MKKTLFFLHHRDVFSGAEKVAVDFSKYIMSEKTANVVNIIPYGSKLHRICDEEDLPYYTFSFPKSYSETNFFVYLSSIFYLNIKIFFLIFSKKNGIIHFNTYYAALMFFPICFLRVFKFTTAFTIHDITSNKARLALTKFLLVINNKAFCVSKATLASITASSDKMLSSKMCLLYNGGNLIKTKPKFHGSNVLVYVGMLTPWKGQVNFLRQCHKKIIESEYFINFIGDGGDKENIRQLINEFGLSDYVSNTGFQHRPFQWCNKENVDFLVHGSILPDPLPTVVLEAASAGILPIVSVYGGACEMLPSNLRSKLVLDPLHKNYGEQLFELINNYTPRVYYDDVEAIQNYLSKYFTQSKKFTVFKDVLF